MSRKRRCWYVAFLSSVAFITRGLWTPSVFGIRWNLPIRGTTDNRRSLRFDSIFYDYRDSELSECRVLRKRSASATLTKTVENNSAHMDEAVSPLQVCSEKCAAPVNKGRVHAGDYLKFERTLPSGNTTVETVQRALHKAWQHNDMNSRSIDLFLRTGCRDAHEVRYLFESVELFWPRSLGFVIVVLDESDRGVTETILPVESQHKYRVFYERHPCMPGRVFNQLSYIMADYYSEADIVVTLDSDCVLHSPVTPDLLFSDTGKILLPWSSKFQEGLWDDEVEYFTGSGTYQGHSMISQPVTIHRSTLISYRLWFAQQSGMCLLDAVVSFLLSDNANLNKHAYCWMCQINTFIQLTGETADKYELIDVDDDASLPYQRFAMHITYESLTGDILGPNQSEEFKISVESSISQGLCQVLGSSRLPTCDGVDLSYLMRNMFSYVGWQWNIDESTKKTAVLRYVEKFRGFL